MAWVTEVPEQQAGPELKKLYDEIHAGFGLVPNFFKAQGAVPPFIEAQMPLFTVVMSDGALSKKIKEQLAVVVSGLNTSSYCVALHMEILRNLGIEKAMGRRLAVDYPNAPVEPNVQALFRFADKLTRKPSDIEQEDFEAARGAGWNERQILEAVLVTALFNFANRVSIGLGLVADF